MHSPTKNDFQMVAGAASNESDFHSELQILREVVRLLPAGVTVQDEHGDFLLVNDAAAGQFRLATGPGMPPQLSNRREAWLALLRSDRPAVVEEVVTCGAERQVFLTSHRPVRTANRDLLLSTSADITDQKAFEDQLFHSAYYDELTGLPTRRVIEHRVNSLLRQKVASSRFALAFLDLDNFKHINDYYGHGIGDALLTEVAKRLSLSLRATDILSRISGDEFLLLLNPVHDEREVAEYIEFMVQRLKAPFFIGQSEIFASISIGVSLYPGTAKATRSCARTPISRCTASRTTARVRRPSSMPLWKSRRSRG
jgi:c-di-GMP phosphodiesterase Gmr